MIDWERIKKQQEEALFRVNKKIVIRSIAAGADRIFISDSHWLVKLADCISLVGRMHTARSRFLVENSKGKLLKMPVKAQRADLSRLIKKMNEGRSDGVTIMEIEK